MNARKFFKKKYQRKTEIDPDEIFLDSENIPGFDVYQMEGRIEQPIAKRALMALSFFFAAVAVIFILRAFTLQIYQGQAYFDISQNNSLKHEPVFAERGVIYDRNNLELAWNAEHKEGEPFPERLYRFPGFAHLLGYVNYPARDSSGFYWNTEFVGRSGAEKDFNSILRGQNGMSILEVNALNEVQSDNFFSPAINGDNLVLSVDARVQEKLSVLIEEYARISDFTGGAGVIMDIRSGEILALTSVPEYDSHILSSGSDQESINKYLTDRRKIFLNRAIQGLYSPGSTIKPFIAFGVLNEHIIDPLKKILSTGSISIPNPYRPDEPYIFKDFKPRGWVDLKQAIAVSSNVYFYVVGGGYQGQKGIGISNIKKYTELFGLGAKTGVNLIGEKSGVVPDPEWKEKNFPGESWRLGDTYHTAIGQYGFQVTPIQMVRAAAAIANKGDLIIPTVLKTDNPSAIERHIDLPIEDFNFIHESMREVVLSGSGQALAYLPVKVAIKTGTAETGPDNKYTHSWIIGFFPYENPRYSFTIAMERSSSEAMGTATVIARDLFDWMNIYTPEYFQSSQN
ncbi:hypothetical protein A3I25_02020 [Candidatus Nomurabacteria bacterium RIFCSPLOWO2_02_FULL_42_17]|uniref:Penicillin-binding protein 2 n=2 Tax=Candidatus Nomuraibacteriota TaxID=1752729 RepID=A0A1F6WHK8_9BACT|nr:MAG: Peptidoglycan glycosyltransferase [Parcubacteria group bacterium GW2011_GWA2_42_18]OGI81388.1 MAG: hypothetical protein A3B93_01645 [Candidatus Nomurabacteria bacterium RIFCSPHIGHO2_02_FULL_42_24]OGI97553.1 MAG: hypothetical protein A3I25_02020 [Candidatus Nomurabacteria bacterium RIFCSPLOWO2_02_FULL_42_17]